MRKSLYLKFSLAYIIFGVFGFIIVAIFIYIIFDKVFLNVSIMNFVIKGVVAECIIIVLHIIVFGRTEEFRYIKNLALRR